jgi:hypothetical protein
VRCPDRRPPRRGGYGCVAKAAVSITPGETRRASSRCADPPGQQRGRARMLADADQVPRQSEQPPIVLALPGRGQAQRIPASSAASCTARGPPPAPRPMTSPHRVTHRRTGARCRSRLSRAVDCPAAAVGRPWLCVPAAHPRGGEAEHGGGVQAEHGEAGPWAAGPASRRVRLRLRRRLWSRPG